MKSYAKPRKLYASVAVISLLSGFLMVMCPECYVSHVCRLMMVEMGDNEMKPGLCSEWKKVEVLSKLYR